VACKKTKDIVKKVLTSALARKFLKAVEDKEGKVARHGTHWRARQDADSGRSMT
jgi:hypothetical protein